MKLKNPFHVDACLKRIDRLLASADDTGCSDDLTVVSKRALNAVSQALQVIRRRSYEVAIGAHDHRHGVNIYPFLVPTTQPFTEEQFLAFLGEEFEEDSGESVTVGPEEIAIVAHGRATARSMDDDTASQPPKITNDQRFHLVWIVDDVQPTIHASFDLYYDCVLAGRRLRREHEEDGVYYIHAKGDVLDMTFFCGEETTSTKQQLADLCQQASELKTHHADKLGEQLVAFALRPGVDLDDPRSVAGNPEHQEGFSVFVDGLRELLDLFSGTTSSYEHYTREELRAYEKHCRFVVTTAAAG